MHSKPFGQIEAADIEDLRARGVPEDQHLEFKGALPEESGRSDPWLSGGNPTNFAVDRLFREVTAFANFRGGMVIAGIVETKTKPPRAESIQPLPRIHDLAARFEDAARDRIDPAIPGLQIRGVEIGAPGHGVLILRTPASVAGPHRVKSSGHVFVRRGTSSVPMGMTEIRDLAIDLAQGADRLNALFQDRATGFSEWLQSTSGEYAACRITAAPSGAFPALPHLSGDPNAFSFRTTFRGSIGPGDVILSGPSLGGFQPIVRGVRRYEHDAENARIEIYETGLIDLWYRHQPVQGYHFFVGWLLGAYLSVLDSIDAARAMAEVPDWEFDVEFAIDGLTGAPRFGGGRVPLAALSLGGFNNTHSPVKIGELPRKFPRLRYRSRREREVAINTLLNDLIDASGERRNAEPLKLTG